MNREHEEQEEFGTEEVENLLPLELADTDGNALHLERAEGDNFARITITMRGPRGTVTTSTLALDIDALVNLIDAADQAVDEIELPGHEE